MVTSPTGAFASMLRPGVRITETTSGYRVLEIASHTAVYMIGSGTVGDYHTPTLVRSLEDLTNQFGSSASEASVKLLFRNNPAANMYFVRARIAPEFVVDSSTAVDGDTYTVSIQGTDTTVTAAGTDLQTLMNALATAINASAVASKVTALAFDDAGTYKLRIRADGDESLVAADIVVSTSGASVLSVNASAAAASLTAADYGAAIERSFDVDDEWPQGFIIAPEAFQLLTEASDRQSVGIALENLAANKDFDWKAIVDCGPGNTTLNDYRSDALLYNSPQGHLDWFAPYLTDLEDGTVPPSAGIVGLATRRYQQEGYQQPYAGARYPVQGVKDVAYKFSNQEQDVLNPLGMNVVRNLRNKGVCAWAMRTRSGDSFYRFSVTRVIMNVLNGSLRSGFDFDLFTSIDGQGVLLARIEETARSVCRRMWIDGALFGNTEEEAFHVKADFENNIADNLELGNVLLEVYAAPAPAMEKLLINTIRVPIGQVQASAEAAQRVTSS